MSSLAPRTPHGVAAPSPPTLTTPVSGSIFGGASPGFVGGNESRSMLAADVMALRREAEARDFVVADLRRQVADLLPARQEVQSLRRQLALVDDRVRARDLAQQAALNELSSKLRLHETVEAQLEAQVLRVEEERLGAQRRLGEQLRDADGRAAEAEAKLAEVQASGAGLAAQAMAAAEAVRAAEQERDDGRAKAAAALAAGRDASAQLAEALRGREDAQSRERAAAAKAAAAEEAAAALREQLAAMAADERRSAASAAASAEEARFAAEAEGAKAAAREVGLAAELAAERKLREVSAHEAARLVARNDDLAADAEAARGEAAAAVAAAEAARRDAAAARDEAAAATTAAAEIDGRAAEGAAEAAAAATAEASRAAAAELRALREAHATLERQLAAAVRDGRASRASRASLEDSAAGVLADYDGFVRALGGAARRVAEGAAAAPPPRPSVETEAALGELLGSAAVGGALDALGSSLGLMRTHVLSCLEQLDAARATASDERAQAAATQSHAAELAAEVVRLNTSQADADAAAERLGADRIALETTTTNAMRRLRASQLALRRGVAVTKQLVAEAREAAGGGGDEGVVGGVGVGVGVGGIVVGGAGGVGGAEGGEGGEGGEGEPDTAELGGWDELCAAHAAALRTLTSERDAALERLGAATARDAARTAADGTPEHWPSVRLLMRALRPLRVRCHELSAQKSLLAAQLAAAEAAATSHASRRTALEAELAELLAALSGKPGGADAAAAAAVGAAAVPAADDGAAGGAARARRRWRVALIAAVAVGRLLRLAGSPGRFLGLRIALGRGRTRRAAVALAPDGLIVCEPLPPPPPPPPPLAAAAYTAGGAAARGATSDAAALLLLVRQLECGAASAPAAPAAEPPPLWLVGTGGSPRDRARANADGGGALVGAVRSIVLRVARSLADEKSKRGAAEAEAEAARRSGGAAAEMIAHLEARVEELQRESALLAPVAALEQLRSEYGSLEAKHEAMATELAQTRVDVLRERGLANAAQAEAAELPGARKAAKAAEEALAECRAALGERAEQCSRMTQFLRSKAREAVAAEEARRTARAALQRAHAELDAQRAHAVRMGAHMAELEAELDSKRELIARAVREGDALEGHSEALQGASRRPPMPSYVPPPLPADEALRTEAARDAALPRRRSLEPGAAHHQHGYYVHAGGPPADSLRRQEEELRRSGAAGSAWASPDLPSQCAPAELQREAEAAWAALNLPPDAVAPAAGPSVGAGPPPAFTRQIDGQIEALEATLAAMDSSCPPSAPASGRCSDSEAEPPSLGAEPLAHGAAPADEPSVGELAAQQAAIVRQLAEAEPAEWAPAAGDAAAAGGLASAPGSPPGGGGSQGEHEN